MMVRVEVTPETNARSNGNCDTETGRMPRKKATSASEHSKSRKSKHNQRPWTTAKDGMDGGGSDVFWSAHVPSFFCAGVRLVKS